MGFLGMHILERISGRGWEKPFIATESTENTE